MKYFGILLSAFGVLCSFICIYVVFSRQPEVKAEQVPVVTEEQKKRDEDKTFWDRRISTEMTYVKDPRDGSCYRRVCCSTLTYTPVSCFAVQSLLANP